MTSNTRVILGGFVVLAVLLAACGGDDGESTASTTTTGPTTTTEPSLLEYFEPINQAHGEFREAALSTAPQPDQAQDPTVFHSHGAAMAPTVQGILDAIEDGGTPPAELADSVDDVADIAAVMLSVYERLQTCEDVLGCALLVNDLPINEYNQAIEEFFVDAGY